jgi:hypothetical protein
MSRKHTQTTATDMVYEFWLIFDAGGSMRMTRAPQTLTRSEKAVFCKATLPKSLFREPELRASFSVPAGSGDPLPINIDVAREALRGALGVDIDIQINNPDLPSGSGQQE